MAPSPATAALVFVGFGIAVAGLYAWLVAGAKATLSWSVLPVPLASRLEALLQALGLSPRLPLVAWSQRRSVPWALVDLVVIVGLQFIAGVVLHSAGFLPTGEIEDLTLNDKHTLIVANAGMSIGLLAVSVLLVAVRCNARSADLGWSWRELQGDLRLGLIGFVMLAPPVYALQGLLVSFWKESKHPIVEMFQAAPDAAFFSLLFVSAALVAPLFEELMFRVLLQGFLEKTVAFRGDLLELLFGPMRFTHESSTRLPPELPQSDNPYAPPQVLIAEPPLAMGELSAEQPELRGLAAWLPIGITSTIFALLHYSHGPDWIPLLLLAAGMGYLYQRTHRLLPSLVVHSLLNAMSMWGLWVAVKQGLSP